MLKERFVVEDLSAHPEAPEIEETGSTFAENARLKAVGISAVIPGMILADDSGLEVDALGEPREYIPPDSPGCKAMMPRTTRN